MFNSARLKLTAWYLLIIMFISVSFSAMIYQASKLELARFERMQRVRIERRLQDREFSWGFPVPPIDPELITETQNRLLFILVIINAGILGIAGGTGYFLAGKTLKPIKEMVEEQNRFISDASHELRTPLTALKTAFEVSLRDRKFDLKEAKKLIACGLEDVNKLKSLSDSLLRLTQYQKPDGNYTFGKVSLEQIVSEAIRRIEPLAKQKRIKLLNKTKECEFKGDHYALVDSLLILLDNAVKYSPENKKIIVTSANIDGFLLIEVKDEGFGIAPKDLPHIFDRFYRADSARSKETVGGYGLGLSIAQKIIQAHRGTISAKSTLNKGTTFVVKLPIFS